METTGGRRKPRYNGHRKMGWQFTLVAAACNPVRIRNLLSTV